MDTKKIFTTLVAAGSIFGMFAHEADTPLRLDEPVVRVRIQASRLYEPMEHTHKEATPLKDLGKYAVDAEVHSTTPIRIRLFDDMSNLADSVSAQI